MTITDFTPVPALVGGALIGLGAAGMWLLLGRMAGVSSILGHAMTAKGGELSWRFAFLAGLLFSGLVAIMVFPDTVTFHLDAGYGQIIAAGVLVGFGSCLGSGCTSGHGVCGVSRLSLRSLTATASFMVAGFLMVYALRHSS